MPPDSRPTPSPGSPAEDPPGRRLVLPGAVTRRRFLLGAAGIGLLAACSSDGDSGVEAGATSSTTMMGGDGSTTTGAAATELTLLSFVPAGAVEAGATSRLAFGVANENGVPLSEGVPELLAVAVLDQNGETVSDGLEAPFRSTDLPRGYYSVETAFAEPGTYTLVTEAGGQELQVPIQVVAAGASPVPGPGRAIPSIVTPTFDDDQGVDPICTRTPEPCPFHEVSFDQALAAGTPTVLFVATPEFCTTAICGPTLDVLIEAASEFGATTVIHAEVYTDRTATTTTEAVNGLGLTYEPALFLIDSTGTVASRLDVIFDGSEVTAAVQALS